jgi:hypothetical protein
LHLKLRVKINFKSLIKTGFERVSSSGAIKVFFPPSFAWKFCKMTLMLWVTFFILWILKIYRVDRPETQQRALRRFQNLLFRDNVVTFRNALSRFQYLYYADRKDLKWEIERDEFVKYICQLNDQHPIQLSEVAKDSHCLAFNRMLHDIRVSSDISKLTFPLHFFEESKKQYNLRHLSFDIIFEATIMLKEELKLKDKIKNEETFEITRNLVAIAREFTSKIQDLKEREENLTTCEVIAFSVENLAIDYKNGTIDYGAFMTVFYEIKSLYFNKPETENLRKRLKNLEFLFLVYARLIRRSQCYLIFDFYPVEELFYLIIKSKEVTPFEDIFLGPKEKNFTLNRLYESHKYEFFGDKVVGKKVNPEDYTQLIKMRFFTKLVNFLNVKKNYSCSDFRRFDYRIWLYTGLSKIEYYLISSTNSCWSHLD